MTMRRVAGVVCASLLLLLVRPGTGVDSVRVSLPERLDDAAFWQMFSAFSEPEGYFPSDNLVSNERAFPGVVGQLTGQMSCAGAYIGVGPEQNFSYLAALRPRIAFIVDIRRQNAVLHLFYKALFELSENRSEFLSRLYSRPRPRHVGAGSGARELMEAFAIVPPSLDLQAAGLGEVRANLSNRHRFGLDPGDLSALDRVSSAFFDAGPELKYSFRSFRRGRPFPTYAELMSATDDQGVPRSYLANEESYQALRHLHQRNLIVPVVGNLAGSKALRSVAAYLRAHGLTVTAFYASNVELYLFRGDQWRSFYHNLAVLPVDRRSVLVRSAMRGFGMNDPRIGAEGQLLLEPIDGLVRAFRRGQITNYGDLLARSRLPERRVEPGSGCPSR